jgi:hypothetical protein
MIAVAVGVLLIAMGLLGLFGPWSTLREPDAQKAQLRAGFVVCIAFGLFMVVVYFP